MQQKTEWMEWYVFNIQLVDVFHTDPTPYNRTVSMDHACQCDIHEEYVFHINSNHKLQQHEQTEIRVHACIDVWFKFDIGFSSVVSR